MDSTGKVVLSEATLKRIDAQHTWWATFRRIPFSYLFHRDLWKDLWRMRKPLDIPSNAEMEVKFQEWFANTNIDDIRSLFLANLLQGHEDYQGGVLDPDYDELDHFERFTSELPTTSQGHIGLSSVLDLLKRAHSKKADALNSASSILRTLIISHAHFPFSKEVPLTKDTLLQAVMLLSSRCDRYWAQSTSINSDDTIRTRPEKRRISSIYSALAMPPKGFFTHDDITDVVCRLNYPMGHWGSFDANPEPMRKIVREIEPLAQRLQPEESPVEVVGIPVEHLQPLVDLVAAFQPQWGEPETDFGFGDRIIVREVDFARWVRRVRLFVCLDLIFEVFFRSPRIQQI